MFQGVGMLPENVLILYKLDNVLAQILILTSLSSCMPPCSLARKYVIGLVINVAPKPGRRCFGNQHVC